MDGTTVIWPKRNTQRSLPFYFWTDQKQRNAKLVTSMFTSLSLEKIIKIREGESESQSESLDAVPWRHVSKDQNRRKSGTIAEESAFPESLTWDKNLI